MIQLDLEVVRYSGPDRWYWRLSDRDGVVIADHEVSLDLGGEQFEAFTRLGRYLRRKVDPSRPQSSEGTIIAWLGEWITANAFGPIAAQLAAAAAERGPVTVALRFAEGVPQAAEALMFRPWELAFLGGNPMAVQDISMVMIPPLNRDPLQPGGPWSKEPVGGSLRMLAVFSLPEGESALLLREQRHALLRTVNEIRQRHRKAIELSVLHYDVSQDRLETALSYGAGWDIVHYSGHGLVDGVILEGTQGEPLTMPAGKLVDMLRLTRSRLKLLVLSSCNSAAAPPAEALTARFGTAPDDGDEPGRRQPLSALAVEAARRLDCAVLAMRFVVDDDFSIALAGNLYRRMLGEDQPLARALQLALPEALGGGPRPGVSPLSVGIPALFGRGCLDLAMAPPPRRTAADDYDVSGQKMASFEPPPEYLVGRSGPMSRATRALRGTGTVGTLFTGPAGIGKTACALELAYRHEHSYGDLVWWQVPRRNPFGSLQAFARVMDGQLSGLKMADEMTSRDKILAFAPRLAQLMEEKAVLVTIDGIDELLTSQGNWRDPYWERIIAALLDHDGFSRLVLTGPRVPNGSGDRLTVEELVPLTPEESVLLARQLPGLGRLIRGTSGIPIQESKRVLAAALTLSAGNPATIRAWDTGLRESNPTAVSEIADASPVYVDLIDRWTAELT